MVQGPVIVSLIRVLRQNRPEARINGSLKLERIHRVDPSTLSEADEHRHDVIIQFLANIHLPNIQQLDSTVSSAHHLVRTHFSQIKAGKHCVISRAVSCKLSLTARAILRYACRRLILAYQPFDACSRISCQLSHNRLCSLMIIHIRCHVRYRSTAPDRSEHLEDCWLPLLLHLAQCGHLGFFGP